MAEKSPVLVTHSCTPSCIPTVAIVIYRLSSIVRRARSGPHLPNTPPHIETRNIILLRSRESSARYTSCREGSHMHVSADGARYLTAEPVCGCLRNGATALSIQARAAPSHTAGLSHTHSHTSIVLNLPTLPGLRAIKSSLLRLPLLSPSPGCHPFRHFYLALIPTTASR